MDKEKIILVGGGGHCKACIDVIEQEGNFEIAGIVDVEDKVGSEVLGYKIIATDSDLNKLSKEYANFFIALGHMKSAAKRVQVFNLLQDLNVWLPSIASPLSYISKHASIGKGTIIMHYAVVNAGSKIGDNCIINSNALIEHDSKVGNHCHVSTGAIINGGVELGEKSFYGSGAISVQNTRIPPHSFIAANTLVKGL